jgi:mannobiose 2-epimerase
MDARAQQGRLAAELVREFHALARWWLTHAVDIRNGAIAGEVSNSNRADPGAGQGLVYISRILWFFSAAYRYEPLPEYRAAAELARRVLEERFSDHENGGLFWLLDAGHRPVSLKKQVYGQAFAVYGLSEYAMAFDDRGALGLARELVELIELYARDHEHGGYLEALDADWSPLADVRLGESDINVEKTMNTHLHVLEAYTHFSRADPGDDARERLSSLVVLFLERFVEPTGDYLERYFTRDWQSIPAARSFGHDIEASWLLWEAATVLGDARLQARVRGASLRLAVAVIRHGRSEQGGVINEWAPGGERDASHVWWVQAEAMVGYHNAWQLSGDRGFLDACTDTWAFIKNHQRDPENGEWLWFSRLDPQAQSIYKAGQWKAPYHNGRALLEMISRLEAGSEADPEP